MASGVPCWDPGSAVPTLIRLMLVVGALAAVAFGVMTAMVTYMKPQPHAISQTIAIPQGGVHR